MDSASIALIANATIAFIIPYLKLLGDEMAKEIGKTAGATTWSKAKQVFDILKTKFSSKPSASEALEDLAKQPEDRDSAAAVRAQLKKIMSSDDEFSKELAGMVREVVEADRYFSPELHNKIYGDNQTIVQTGNAPVSVGNDFTLHDKIGRDKVEIHIQHLSWTEDRMVDANEQWIQEGVNWLRRQYDHEHYRFDFSSLETTARSLNDAALYERGRNLTDDREYAQATAYWAELRKRHQKNSEYASYLNLCLSKIERDMRIDGAVSALLGKATSAYRVNKYERALDWINQALILSPHNPQADTGSVGCSPHLCASR